jgi:hypothetical protein
MDKHAQNVSGAYTAAPGVMVPLRVAATSTLSHTLFSFRQFDKQSHVARSTSTECWWRLVPMDGLTSIYCLYSSKTFYGPGVLGMLKGSPGEVKDVAEYPCVFGVAVITDSSSATRALRAVFSEGMSPTGQDNLFVRS